MRVRWEAGYSDSLLSEAEARWDFQFPPDLRELLLDRKPVGNGIWDWHSANDEAVEAQRAWIADGLAFDAVFNDFWLDEFGHKPDLSTKPENWGDSTAVAKFLKPIVDDIIRPALDKAPPLIPIAFHRFMPTKPSVRGLPVISIMQTDIIAYGVNLRDYFQREFGEDIGAQYSTPIRHMSEDAPWNQPVFWNALIS